MSSFTSSICFICKYVLRHKIRSLLMVLVAAGFVVVLSVMQVNIRENSNQVNWLYENTQVEGTFVVDPRGGVVSRNGSISTRLLRNMLEINNEELLVDKEEGLETSQNSDESEISSLSDFHEKNQGEEIDIEIRPFIDTYYAEGNAQMLTFWLSPEGLPDDATTIYLDQLDPVSMWGFNERRWVEDFHGQEILLDLSYMWIEEISREHLEEFIFTNPELQNHEGGLIDPNLDSTHEDTTSNHLDSVLEETTSNHLDSILEETTNYNLDSSQQDSYKNESATVSSGFIVAYDSKYLTSEDKEFLSTFISEEFGDGNPLIFISETIADLHGISPGDDIWVTRPRAMHPDQSFRLSNFQPYRVVGTFPGMGMTDVILPIHFLQEELGSDLFFDRVTFFIDPLLNRELGLFRETAIQVLAEHDPPFILILNDQVLQEVVGPLERNIAMMAGLYPIVLGLSGLTAIALTILLMLPLIKTQAVMRTLGKSKKSTFSLWLGEQLSLCILGLAVGVLISYLAVGGVNVFGILFYFLGNLLGATLFMMIIMRRKPLELLQLRE